MHTQKQRLRLRRFLIRGANDHMTWNLHCHPRDHFSLVKECWRCHSQTQGVPFSRRALVSPRLTEEDGENEYMSPTFLSAPEENLPPKEERTSPRRIVKSIRKLTENCQPQILTCVARDSHLESPTSRLCQNIKLNRHSPRVETPLRIRTIPWSWGCKFTNPPILRSIRNIEHGKRSWVDFIHLTSSGSSRLKCYLELVELEQSNRNEADRKGTRWASTFDSSFDLLRGAFCI